MFQGKGDVRVVFVIEAFGVRPTMEFDKSKTAAWKSEQVKGDMA